MPFFSPVSRYTKEVPFTSTVLVTASAKLVAIVSISRHLIWLDRHIEEAGGYLRFSAHPEKMPLPSCFSSPACSNALITNETDRSHIVLQKRGRFRCRHRMFFAGYATDRSQSCFNGGGNPRNASADRSVSSKLDIMRS